MSHAKSSLHWSVIHYQGLLSDILGVVRNVNWNTIINLISADVPISTYQLLYRSLITGSMQARMCKIQGLFKDFSDFPTVFKD